MSGYWRATVDLILASLMSDSRYDDATDEEIVDLVIQSAPPSLTFPDFERRKLREEVAERRSADEQDDLAPEAAVRAERARRKAAHLPYGYDALSKHFRVSEATIRRRLGKL